MTKKTIANILFYSFGSIILVSTIFVVSFNFYKHSRLLGVNYPDSQPEMNSDVIDSTQIPEKVIEDKLSEDLQEFETISYERAKIQYPDSLKTDPNEKMKEDVFYEDEKTYKAKVLIMNYSGAEDLAKKVQESIENRGYLVDIELEDDKIRSSTIILQKTTKDYAREIQRFLKKGQLVREIDDDAEYEIYIILGEDFLP